jgi:pimeloyl-ACP methyl ester carboxylesterase
MTRRDGLRILPAVADAGLPILVPTYRNDEGAPASSHGRLTYGKEEWRDLEAAVQYTLDHGAEAVVLEGMSMGGSVVAAFLLESELADRVAGVIFDAPVLDFERSVEHQAAAERVPLVGLPIPPTIVTVAEWLTDIRFGIDWTYTHYLDRADELSAPMLLIHGGDDDDVPVGLTHDLERTRPDIVRDVYIPDSAGHTEAWNVDPAEYERRVIGFLEALAVVE